MAYKVILAPRNSAYKVFQNPMKGNSYSDIIAFKTLEERDEFMNGFLGYDWKKKFHEHNELTKIPKFVDEAHISVTLDLTRDTDFGLEKRKAQQADLLIMEDTNENDDSPYKYTFWGCSANYTQNQVYTTLEFHAEIDPFMTIPIDHMMKNLGDVEIRAERAESNKEIGYGSELSFGEEFQFGIDNYINTYKKELKNTRFVFGNKKSDTTMEDTAVIVSLSSANASSSGELLNYEYDFPVFYSTDSANTIKQHVLKLDKLKVPVNVEAQGLVVPDITYLVFKNKIAVPNEIKRSQYLISMEQTPVPYSLLTPSNPSEVITLDGKQITAIDISLDAELRKSLAFNLSLNKVDPSGKISQETIGNAMRENGLNAGELLDRHNKMLHSSFNKTVLTYGQINFEIKPENWNFEDDSSSLHGEFIFTPQAIDIQADLNNNPYYDINYVWHYRTISIKGDFKLPTIVKGDQATMQNFNSTNLTSSINSRDAVFQEIQGGYTIAGGALNAAKGGAMAWLTGGIAGWGRMVQGASEITQGIQMEMSAHDNINRQAASLADAKNNVGKFNDGTIDGIETYDSQGIALYKYKLQEPLRKMCVDWFKMYAYNMGGALFKFKDLIHARAKHDYLRVSDDVGVIYQALAEDISPAISKLIAITFLQGVRLWWSDKFTYVGDYTEANNVIVDGKEIPNTDIQ